MLCEMHEEGVSSGRGNLEQRMQPVRQRKSRQAACERSLHPFLEIVESKSQLQTTGCMKLKLLLARSRGTPLSGSRYDCFGGRTC